MKKVILAISILMMTTLTGCLGMTGQTGTDAAAEAPGFVQLLMPIGIMVVFFVFMYFIMIRPQRKEQKEQQAMLASMRVGDTVLTTSGFYGVVIDITDDTIIVEFGNNKNCRIPMQRQAVVRLEHPEDGSNQVSPTSVKTDAEKKAEEEAKAIESK